MIAKDIQETIPLATIAEPLAVRLSRNISKQRQALGLTQAQLAERLGIETETLSRFERGKNLPSLLKLESLAGVLFTTVGDLLSEESIVADDDAIAISSWLSRLSPEDKLFAKGMLKQLCGYLGGRGSGLLFSIPNESDCNDEKTEDKN
jgi:transcriptional regulator with XRE-family HTH domain